MDFTRGHFEQLSRETRRPDSRSREASTLLVKGRLNIDVFIIRSRVPLPSPQTKDLYTVPPECPSPRNNGPRAPAGGGSQIVPMISLPEPLLWFELTFHAKARHVRVRKSVNDRHDLGDDEDEDNHPTGG